MTQTVTQKIMALNGAEAIAEAMRQINPDVVASYPITPQTIIVERFSEFVADGLVDTEFIAAESEHSALSASIGAAAAGGRAMTATASQGFALMWEMLYIAAGMRLPIVMAVANRALGAPININCDHGDSMGGRDSGWIQLYSENVQEAYDNTVQAVKIGENRDVRLPVMVCMDGFTTSHAVERVDVLDDDTVKKFVGEYHIDHPLLDVDHAVTYGAMDLSDYYFEHKMQQIEAMKKAKPVIEQVSRAYGALSGRSYGLVEPYNMENADLAIVILGSTAGTVKSLIDEVNDPRLGLLKIRAFRPFPTEEIAANLKNCKAVAVLDRAASFGGIGGTVFPEVRAALYDVPNRPQIVNYIYGLGGRDTTMDMLKTVYDDLDTTVKTGKSDPVLRFLGLRGD
jgi:pyruvate ferredoxin oxidoreductase alpha subunit